MKKFVGLCFVIFATSSAIELSNRIKALGSDFALLIPDYETDTYYFPNVIDCTFFGAAFDRNTTAPLKMLFAGSRVGTFMRYWPDYTYGYSGYYGYWRSATDFKFNFADLWFLKIRHNIFNLRNDGVISHYLSDDSNNGQTDDLKIKYFFNTSHAFNLGSRFRLNIIVGTGTFYHTRQVNSVYGEQNMIWFNSLRPGLFYRTMNPDSSFTSSYIEIGGPISWAEYDALPFSMTDEYSEPLLNMPDMIYFGAVWSRLGWTRGISVNNRGYLYYGFNDAFVYQEIGPPYRNTDCLGLNNAFTLQLAFEYPVNNMVLRCGTALQYNFQRSRVTDYDYNYEYRILVSENINHNLVYCYSFGLGWRPWEKFRVDLLTFGDISNIYNWSLALYYE